MAKKSKKPHVRYLENLSVLLFFLFTAALHMHNATRDIYSGDIGDLVTAAYVFGVAHPPGYPLFTLLGGIFAHIPFPIPVVTRVAYVSVLASLGGLIAFYWFGRYVSKNVFIALLATAILAFSHYYWLFAEIPEVFGLNNFFVIAILSLSYCFYHTKNVRVLYALGFLTGLSITHHHTIIFLFPGALFLILQHYKLFLKSKLIIFKGLVFLIAGLSVYLYVPLAASTNPVVNWDTVTSWDNFVRLFLRQDYQTVGSGSLPILQRMILLRDYANSIFDNFSYQIIFVAALGAVKLYSSDKKMLIALLLSFLLSGPIFIAYIGAPSTTAAAWGIIERFYTMSATVLVFFIPYGLIFIKAIVEKLLKKPLYSYAALSYFLIIPIFMLIYNFPKTDLSHTQIGNNYAKDIIANLPENSLLFVSGDTTTFNLWYAHHVLDMRPDVGLINPPKVGGTNYMDNEINTYKSKYPKTETSEIFNKTLDSLRSSRRIFGTYEFDYRPENTTLVPKGMVFELLANDRIPQKDAYIDEVEKRLKTFNIVRRETLPLSDSNLITPEIPLIYSNALVDIGDFMTSYYKDHQKAEHYYRRALWVDPDNPSAYAGLSLSLFHAYKDCRGSIQQMNIAIEIYPIWEQYYRQLYTLHKKCGSDEKILQELEAHYKSIFKRSIAI